MPCAQCSGIEEQFDAPTARSQLRKFRRRGPDRTTRMLLDDLRAAMRGGQPVAMLLDIGAGVGAIHHTLLDHGIERAIHVDASTAYLAAAREEAERRGHAGRVEFRRGDFVDLAPDVPVADVVTLDRVICCYPEMRELVTRAGERARVLFGAVFPRDDWWVRTATAFINTFMRLSRSTFRTFLHPPSEIDATLRSVGLRRRSMRRTFVWEVVVYEHG
jgi:2-polyprenyl-3-methyl-5-hydroxy-6-metoxy-1,4-benzoquinol methylase